MGGFKKLKIFNFRKRNRAQSLPETVMATQFASLGATADAKARAHRNSDATQPPVPRTHRNSDVTQPHMARRHRNSDVTQPVFPRRHRNSDITRPQGLFPMFPVCSALVVQPRAIAISVDYAADLCTKFQRRRTIGGH